MDADAVGRCKQEWGWPMHCSIKKSSRAEWVWCKPMRCTANCGPCMQGHGTAKCEKKGARISSSSYVALEGPEGAFLRIEVTCHSGLLRSGTIVELVTCITANFPVLACRMVGNPEESTPREVLTAARTLQKHHRYREHCLYSLVLSAHHWCQWRVSPMNRLGFHPLVFHSAPPEPSSLPSVCHSPESATQCRKSVAPSLSPPSFVWSCMSLEHHRTQLGYHNQESVCPKLHLLSRLSLERPNACLLSSSDNLRQAISASWKHLSQDSPVLGVRCFPVSRGKQRRTIENNGVQTP